MSTKLISVNRKLSAQKYNSTGVTPFSPAATDAYFNYNVLLLHGDGANGANNTVFVDSSTNAFTITTNSKPYQGTFSPLSQTGWSAGFNLSANSDALATTNFDASLTPGTSDYTIEFWVYPTATSGRQNWFNLAGSSGFNRILIYYTGSAVSLDIGVGSAATSKITYTVTLSTLAFTWNHIAVSRVSGTTKMFLNGTQIGSDYVASDNWTSAFKMTTMRDPGGSTWGSGYMSNIRYIIGTGLYSANFTPSTTKLTTTGSATRLLTLQDNYYKDNGANNQPFTLTGTPLIQPFSPFSPSSAYSTSAVGGSISFNGSSDYLSGTADPFGMGTGDFTVEFWLYKNNAWSTGDQMILDAGASTSMGVWVNTTAGTLRMSRSGVDAPIEYSYSTLTSNQWYHVAFSRSGTTLSMYINGNRVNTVTSSVSFATGTTFNIGRNTAASQYWNGYISNFRAVKGSAVYDPSQTTITVPTSPLTAVANTSLLLNATNAGIIDHTAKNTLTTFGSGSIISTGQSKFGSASINQDGTNSYVFIPSSQLFNFGSGNFTIECWVYVTATNTRTAFLSKSNSAGTTVPFLLEMTSAGLPQGIAQDTTSQKVVTGTGNALTVNTWTHLALVRSGNTLTLYKDGTSIGTPQTMSGALVTSTDEIRIGVNKFGSSSVNFYIDDIRVTAGYARYTSNFTAPTSAFIDQ